MWRRFVEEDIHLKTFQACDAFFLFCFARFWLQTRARERELREKKRKKSSGKRSNFELAVNHCPVVFFLPDSERLAHRGTRSFAGFLAWDHPYHRISKLNPTTQVDEVFLFLRGNWPTLKKRKKEKKREKKKSRTFLHRLPSNPHRLYIIHILNRNEFSRSIERCTCACACIYLFFPLVIFLNFVTRENSNEESERESCAWTSEKERGRERARARASEERESELESWLESW